MKKNVKGITLIALVITIIILLILAAVSIVTLTGENGLLTKAKTASEETEKASAEESIKMVVAEWQIEKQIGKITLEKFLDKKVPNELDAYDKVSDNEYELEKYGYVLTIDENGNIILEIQKAGIKPKVDNIQITLENGETVEDNSQGVGTKLKITFDTSIEGGEIIEVTPGNLLENNKVEYVTDGNEKIITFTVKGKVNGEISSKMEKISVENKYMISKSSLMEAIEGINTSSENRPIQIEGNGETVVYNTDIIVYDGNLTLDGEEKNIDNISLSQTTYSIGNQNDVGNANANAKNMVILKVNGNLEIGNGVTITAYANANGYGGPKGLFIYCTGTLTNNGTINMTARGAKGQGENVYLYKNSDKTYEFVPAQGAAGGKGVKPATDYGIHNGNPGSQGVYRQTGGGASGYSKGASISTKYSSGAGSYGTSYAGGSGGGSTDGVSSCR